MISFFPYFGGADPRLRQGVSPPESEIDGSGAQNRLTVAFRLALVIPQLVVTACLAIAAMVVQILDGSRRW